MTIAIPGPIGKPFDGAEIAEPRAGAVWFFYSLNLQCKCNRVKK